MDNYQTTVTTRTGSKINISAEMRDSLVAESENYLPYDQYYQWNANINGIDIQLPTNLRHLYQFWMESWYPAELESDLEPHGIIYAVMDVPPGNHFLTTILIQKHQ